MEYSVFVVRAQVHTPDAKKHSNAIICFATKDDQDTFFNTSSNEKLELLNHVEMGSMPCKEKVFKAAEKYKLLWLNSTAELT